MEEYNLPEDIWRLIDNLEEQDDRIAQELDIYSCSVDTPMNNTVANPEGYQTWR